MDPPRSYVLSDKYTEWLVYFAVVFSPWAFGTTQEWSIRVMNTVGYMLGILLLVKWWVRWRAGYRPPRWADEPARRDEASWLGSRAKAGRLLTCSLAVLTLLFLAYCLASAWNARAWFRDGVQVFNDDYIPWLPHSYAADSTWVGFWNCLALACLFWAARDWLLGKTEREATYPEQVLPLLMPAAPPPLPKRLTRLLWVLCINGTVVGVVSIFQRLDATEELLWILPSRAGGPDFHFGPFNYRGNGAQYFNLLWPVTLAFWWVSLRASQVLRRAGRRIGEEPYLLLLPCALLQAACPVISASHGGAVIAVCLVVGGLGVLLGANWHAAPGSRVAILVPFAVGLALAAYLGWGQYQKGLTTAFTDDMGDRIEIYQNASQMAVDHPLFGTGPATFPAIYQLYRASEKHGEAAYAHNDWLEVLITFGWLGTILLTLMLAHVFARWWISDGIECRWDFPAMIWLSMAGCLFHARFDFPFQVYSIVVLFLVLSCVTCCAARKP